MTREERIERLTDFLSKEYPHTQAFNTPNLVGDYMESVYEDGGIEVLYAPGYGYVEIFGLTESEFENITVISEWGSRYTLGEEKDDEDGD